MMAEAERGAFDVVVVHKIDRFARNLRVQMECLDRLGKARVMFVSVSEPNLDYSRPGDFLVLTMFGAMAQQYSMNLSQETKKGWDERRRKGLYCGLLPFGAMKDANGIPVPDTRSIEINGLTSSNYEGLLLAFRRAAEGADDLEVAEALNAAGYCPSARNKRGVFTRESVRVILTNRFYLGQLPEGKRGKGGWIEGMHQPMTPQELWDAAQHHRGQRRAKVGAATMPHSARTYSLSGVLRCGQCGGKLHTHSNRRGMARVYCYTRDNLRGCEQRTVALQVLEEQVAQQLEALTIPDDYQRIVLEALISERPEMKQNEANRRELRARLRRVGDRYELGEISKSEYEARCAALQAEIGRSETEDTLAHPDVLERLRGYLERVPAAWLDASPEQRQKLVRTLFEEIVVEGDRVVGAIPRGEYCPFFVLGINKHPGRTPQTCGETDRGALTCGLEGIRTPDLGLDRAAC
jgi:site-specific DNA recombinase